jgi:phosphate transport system substrate-binding protein
VKFVRSGTVAGLAVLGLVGLGACGSDNNNGSGSASAPATKTSCATGSINGAGSTFQQNIQQQWSKDFGQQCSGAQINYAGTGSGAGISQFGAGTIDFAGSDVTMKLVEQAKADAACGSPALHIPISAGGVAIIYNLKGVDQLKLSAKTLAGIFQGSITKWDDPAIAADNGGAKLPATTISPFHRSDGSGTTQVFSGFLAANASGTWALGANKQLNWPAGAGQAAKGSDGVTAGVKATNGGITYAELSFAKANQLPYAEVKGAGDFVALSADTVSKAISGFTVTGTGNNLAGTVDYATTSGYPVSTVTYAIVCSKYKDAAKGRLARAYFAYAVGSGQSAAAGLGYAPLPGELVAKAKAAVGAVG